MEKENKHEEGCICGCCYGYHEHLTLHGGDGFFDIWKCDECGKDAICTGDLLNSGAEKMNEFWLRNINEIQYLTQMSELMDSRGKLAKEILNLHQRIDFLTRKVIDNG